MSHSSHDIRVLFCGREIVDPQTVGYCPNILKSLSLISSTHPTPASLFMPLHLSVHLFIPHLSPSPFISISLSVCLYLPPPPPAPAFASSFLIQCVKIGRGYFTILREENAMKKREQQLQKLKEEELNKFQPAKKYSDIQCRSTLMT